jgi:hypothetical protein
MEPFQEHTPGDVEARQLEAGDTVRLRRLDSGYETRPLPVLSVTSDQLVLSTGKRTRLFKTYRCQVVDGHLVTIEHVYFALFGRKENAATRESAIYRIWKHCAQSGKTACPFPCPESHELSSEEMSWLIDVLARDEDLSDKDQRKTAMLTLFDGDCEAALSATVEHIVTLLSELKRLQLVRLRNGA